MPNISILVTCAAAVLPVVNSSPAAPSLGKLLEVKSATASAPANKLSAMQTDGAILIAQKYGGSDPHGRDPHVEIHDSRLPANKKDLPANEHRDDHVAPDDVYGYKFPNGQKPY